MKPNYKTAYLRDIAGMALVLALCAGTSHSEPMGEPHLQIVPRDASEVAKVAAAVANSTDFSQPERFEHRPAGLATLMDAPSRKSFSMPQPNLNEDQGLDFVLGQSLFEKLWVTPPSATVSSDGLGPLYNARACSICHIGNGRGRPPLDDTDRLGALFLRVSIPDEASSLAPDLLDKMSNAPEPTYGLQLQDKSVAGLPAEGRLAVRYSPVAVTLADGTIVELQKPEYALQNPGYGDLHPQAQLSPRIAPQMIGLGLLEAIPEADILAHADPDDQDGDGISGRANLVWSKEYDQWMLGRFGLKAGASTVRAQSMAAANGDIGLSNSLFPVATGDCTAQQTACLTAPDGNTAAQGGVEASDPVMDLMTFYSRTLAVPARRDVDDPEVLEGKAAFYQAGCPACHVPKFVTHRLANRAEHSFQLIWPYTDMLLHDLGEGLADNRPEWQANGREWRTPPLWGIGLTQTVSGHSRFLHDGRARTMLEAILWHGGEATAAQQAVIAMPKSQRDALIAFLESL